MCPVKGQMQCIRGVRIFSNICGVEIILSWLGVNDSLSRSNRGEMMSTWAFSQVKRLSIPTERWPAPLSLYPCRGLNEGVILYDNEALEKFANVDISVICPESMVRMGKRQVPPIEGEIPHQAGISLSRPWFSYTSRVFSFEEAGRRFSSPSSCQYVDLLLVHTWGTPQHRQLPLKLAECFQRLQERSIVHTRWW